jgi:methylmalonyl-CoA decarboxylase subunit alpha
MNKLEVFNSIKDKAHQGGGTDKVEMQHNLNKTTARERIATLLDEGSFIELGALVAGNAAGVVTGYGTINGRLTYVYSYDYTVEGGTFNKAMAKKICSLLDNAAKMGAPVVHIIDSIGAKLNEGIELLSSYGMVLRRIGKFSGVIPQVSIICGPCYGMATLGATMTDFTIIVNNVGEIGINSSEKLSTVEEKYVDSSMFSDSFYANKNGNAHFSVESEEDGFNVARKLIDYLPANNLESPWISVEDYNLNTPKEALDEMIVNENHSMDHIVKTIADENSILEINKEFMESFKTALVKINGLTVGVIWNSFVKSKITNEGAMKVSNFVRLCDGFNIPIVSLVDTKGFAVSLEEEKKGLARSAGKLLYSLIDASVPKVSLIVGDAYGAGYVALAGKEAAFDVTLAWPSAKVALTNPETLIKSIHREEILSSADPKIKESEVVAKYLEEVVSPYTAAELGLIDDIIKPSETKQRLFALIDMLQSKRELGYPKKHGSTLV